MIVAIMQPYFFPYIGYFQLMQAVDTFVVYDEAQFMKSGWINRNRILLDGVPRWWTFAVEHDSYLRPIRERRYDRPARQRPSLLGKFDAAYRRAPHFAASRLLLDACLDRDEDSVSLANEASLATVARHLGITCRIVRSSDIDHDRRLAGEARVIELCGRLGGDRYVNAIGGQGLYSAANFRDAGISLGFLRPRPRAYVQFDAPHVPSLSIVDVLAFNTHAAACAMLHDHDILDAA